MERWPLERRGAKTLGFLFTCLAMLFLLYGCVYVVTTFFRIAVFEKRDYLLSAFAILLFVALGVLVVAGLAYNTVDSLSRVFITPRGVERRLFGKCRGFIPWDSLAETGIALEWSRTIAQRTLYFSDHPLEEAERIYFDSYPSFKAGVPISVRCSHLKNLEKLIELCPLPIPPTDNSQGYQDRYDLPSYRRERDDRGNWGETTAAFIATAAVENMKEKDNARWKEEAAARWKAPWKRK